jgi:hypothetical protein
MHFQSFMGFSTVYGLLVKFGLCDVVCKLFALKMMWVSLTVYICSVALPVEKRYCLEISGPALPLVFLGGSSLSNENGTAIHSLWIIFRLCLSFNCVAFMAIMHAPWYKLCKYDYGNLWWC